VPLHLFFAWTSAIGFKYLEEVVPVQRDDMLTPHKSMRHKVLVHHTGGCPSAIFPPPFPTLFELDWEGEASMGKILHAMCFKLGTLQA